MLESERAEFELACRLRAGPGPPLGEVFSFLSGLYFRGKLAYARAFAAPPATLPGQYIITPSDGLCLAEQPVDRERLRRFAAVDIDAGDPRYLHPLVRDVRLLAAALGPDCEIVLLGSIATGKYVDVLLDVFGSRLRFPEEFVGRGDMSRGSLMLRRAESLEELTCVPVDGRARHGKRPPRLEPRRWPRPVT
jgi:hypothetical protein